MACENKYTTLLDLARQAKIITGDTACLDGKIQVGIPFSGYPTGVDTGTTVSLGIVSTESAVLSGNNLTTLFDVANPSSPNYNAIFDPYSANTWTNPLFSTNTSGLTLPITPLSADSQVIGPIWTLTQTGMTGEYVIATQYTGYSITYSPFFLSGYFSGATGTTYSAVTGFTSAVQENFSAGTLDYKGPLDYLSSKEDMTVSGRLTTNKLTVTNGASSSTTNYVLTQMDDTGKVKWSPVSGVTSGVTFWEETGVGNTALQDEKGLHTIIGTSTDSMIAGGSNNYITASTRSFIGGGRSNEIGNGGGSSQYSALVGGFENKIHDASEFSFIGAGRSNKIYGDSDYSTIIASFNSNLYSGDYSAIIASNGSEISGTTIKSKGNIIMGGTDHNIIYTPLGDDYSTIIGGNTNIVQGAGSSSILGGDNNTIKTWYSTIVGGSGNTIGAAYTTILGGQGIVAGNANTAYMNNLYVIDGNADIDYDNNGDAKLAITNYDNGNNARSLVTFNVAGEGGDRSATLAHVGTGFTSSGTWTGSYLPNSFNILTAGGNTSNRSHINIGTRRVDGEIRFFGGGNAFDNTTLLSIFYTSGLTVTDMVNTDTLRVRSGANNGYVLTSDADGVATWQPNGVAEVTTATTTTIDFTGQTIYYNSSSPATGNISENLSGAKLGTIQKIYHNDVSEPTYPAGWVLMGDAIYFTSTLNIIYAEWAGGSRVEYWYVQEQ